MLTPYLLPCCTSVNQAQHTQPPPVSCMQHKVCGPHLYHLYRACNTRCVVLTCTTCIVHATQGVWSSPVPPVSCMQHKVCGPHLYHLSRRPVGQLVKAGCAEGVQTRYQHFGLASPEGFQAYAAGDTVVHPLVHPSCRHLDSGRLALPGSAVQSVIHSHCLAHTVCVARQLQGTAPRRPVGHETSACGCDWLSDVMTCSGGSCFGFAFVHRQLPCVWEGL